MRRNDLLLELLVVSDGGGGEPSGLSCSPLLIAAVVRRSELELPSPAAEEDDDDDDRGGWLLPTHDGLTNDGESGPCGMGAKKRSWPACCWRRRGRRGGMRGGDQNWAKGAKEGWRAACSRPFARFL